MVRARRAFSATSRQRPSYRRLAPVQIPHGDSSRVPIAFQFPNLLETRSLSGKLGSLVCTDTLSESFRQILQYLPPHPSPCSPLSCSAGQKMPAMKLPKPSMCRSRYVASFLLSFPSWAAVKAMCAMSMVAERGMHGEYEEVILRLVGENCAWQGYREDDPTEDLSLGDRQLRMNLGN